MSKEAKTNLITLVILLATLAASFAVQSYRAERPWMNYRDANGATHGRIAANYFRQGLMKYRLAPVYDYSAPEYAKIFQLKFRGNPFFTIKENRAFISHYPPTMNLLIYAAYRVFGATPAATRLLAIFTTLLGAVFLFLFARIHLGRTAALAAVFFWSLSPMTLCYGQMTDTIIFISAFALGALWQYSLWDETRRARNLAGVFAFVAAGCLFGWYCYFLVPLIVAHHLFARRGRFSYMIFFGLPSVAAACLALFVAYLMWMAGPEAIREWIAAYTVRRGYSIEINGVLYPFSTFQFIKTVFLRIPFHYTWVVFIAAAAWLWGMKKRPSWRPPRAAAALMLSGAYGLMPALFFRQGVYVHGFYLCLFGPAVAMCAGAAVARLIESRNIYPRVAAVAIAAAFLISAYPNYKLMANYLIIDHAKEFTKFVESVSDENTVIAQDIYDFGMVLWSNNWTDRFMLQREMTRRDIEEAVSLLPPGRRMIYIHLPLPEAYRLPHTEETLAWLYKKYGYREVDGYVIFDTTLKPAPLENPVESERALVRFQDRIELLSAEIKPSGRIINAKTTMPGTAAARAGDKMRISYKWKCLKTMPDDFQILVKIIPGLLHNDHEPVKSMYLTSHWKPGEIITETYEIELPSDLPVGEYPVEIALCAKRDPKAFCLQPTGKMLEQKQGFVKVAGLEILPPENPAAQAEIDKKLADAIADVDSYIEYSDLNSFRRFVKFMSVDPAMAESFSGWQYLFEQDYERAIPILENLTETFDSYALIEKMVPTAMSEVPAMLKSRLVMLYLERRQIYPAAKNAVSLIFNLPVSYQIYSRIGRQFDKNAADSKAPFLLIAMSDWCYSRMAAMKPDDKDNLMRAINHYIATGRPHKAFQLARSYTGSQSEFDVRVNASFAADSLSRGAVSDYRFQRRRMHALGAGRDFDEAVFNRLEQSGEPRKQLLFIRHIGKRADRKDYWLRAMDAAAYNRNFDALSVLADAFAPGEIGLDQAERKQLSNYYEMLGMIAYNAGDADASAQFYEKSLRAAPDSASAMFNLALLRDAQGRSDEAEAILKRLLRLEPDDKAASDKLLEIIARNRGAQ